MLKSLLICTLLSSAGVMASDQFPSSPQGGEIDSREENPQPATHIIEIKDDQKDKSLTLLEFPFLESQSLDKQNNGKLFFFERDLEESKTYKLHEENKNVSILLLKKAGQTIDHFYVPTVENSRLDGIVYFLLGKSSNITIDKIDSLEIKENTFFFKTGNGYTIGGILKGMVGESVQKLTVTGLRQPQRGFSHPSWVSINYKLPDDQPCRKLWLNLDVILYQGEAQKWSGSSNILGMGNWRSKKEQSLPSPVYGHSVNPQPLPLINQGLVPLPCLGGGLKRPLENPLMPPVKRPALFPSRESAFLELRQVNPSIKIDSAFYLKIASMILKIPVQENHKTEFDVDNLTYKLVQERKKGQPCLTLNYKEQEWKYQLKVVLDKDIKTKRGDIEHTFYLTSSKEKAYVHKI